MLKTMDETACEDLKAFERRFTEIVDSMQPSAGRWRILLVVSSVCTAVGAYQWLSDPITLDVGFCESLKNHLFFTLSLFLLLLLFLGCGIHKRVVAPSIIASRCRYVLTDFNLSCDDLRVVIGGMADGGPDVEETSLLAENIVPIIVSVIVVFGGTIPFVFQYHEIKKSQNTRGFSLHVCLALLVANILRVMFWIGKRFELQLLFQSLVMILMMLLLVRKVVSVKRKQALPPVKLRSVWSGEFTSHFWNWTDFSSYLCVVALFSTFMALITNLLFFSSIYIETLGFASLFMEGNLGTPQFLNNWKRKSTVGMSIRMVLMWFFGDISKTIYFLVRNTPIQFWLCGMYQIGMDILILSQVLMYRSSASHRKYDTPPSSI